MGLLTNGWRLQSYVNSFLPVRRSCSSLGQCCKSLTGLPCHQPQLMQCELTHNLYASQTAIVPSCNQVFFRYYIIPQRKEGRRWNKPNDISGVKETTVSQIWNAVPLDIDNLQSLCQGTKLCKFFDKENTDATWCFSLWNILMAMLSFPSGILLSQSKELSPLIWFGQTFCQNQEGRNLQDGL